MASPDQGHRHPEPEQAISRSFLFQSIRPLNRKRAFRDILAGLQLAAMNIPQVLGYARIAGMPVITGLYTLLLPPVAFAALGSSRYLVVAADSATAAILFAGLSVFAPVASPRYVELAVTVAVMTAGFLLLARLLKLGFLADFLSRTVLVGFLTGVGFQVGIAVLGGMLGLVVQAHRTVHQVAEIYTQWPAVHWPTLAISAIAVTALLLLGKFAPRVPAPLIAVVLGIAASRRWHFADHGIALVASLSGGVLHFGLPHLHWSDVDNLVPIAASCLVVILAQSAATARVYAARHQSPLDEDADLLGLSAANALAGVSGTFVVNGSPTQTAMAESSGARSQLAQITMAVVAALVLAFATRPLEDLPRCVLNAIVFVIAIKLIDLGKLLKIRRESPGEYALAVITAAVVVLVGVEQGIILAMVLSLLRIVKHTYRPHTGVLAADGDQYWRVLPPHPGVTTEKGLVVYRFGAPLFYANAGGFAKEVTTILGLPKVATPPVRWVIVDAEAITNLDYSAARVVRELDQELEHMGIKLAFAHVSSFLKADFDRHHVTEVVGEGMLFRRLRDALNAFAQFTERDAAPK